jgi:hypothetical protein
MRYCWSNAQEFFLSGEKFDANWVSVQWSSHIARVINVLYFTYQYYREGR